MNKSTHDKFIAIFSYLLEDNELSRTDFCENCGIPYGTVSGWMNQGRLPEYEALVKIADFFDVTLDYLMGRTSDSINLQGEQYQKKLKVDVHGLDKEDVQLLQSIANRIKKNK